MNLVVHLYLHNDSEPKLDQILTLLTALKGQETQIMDNLANLSTQVARNKDVTDSAVVLLTGLKTALDAAGTDPVKLKSLSDSLGTETDTLAAAVVANTPAAPAAAPTA